jgi:hypothetical protein
MKSLPDFVWTRRALLAGACALPFGARGQSPVIFNIVVSAGRVTGDSIETPARGAATLRVKRGDQIELRWSVDAPAELHLHGYNIETRARPGSMTVLTFVARATGRFPVETHDAQGRHRVLLYVEVHPR